MTRPSSFVQELHAYLAERLPDYMLPAAFVLLDALPLTPNGKVNRQALPTPDSVRPELDQGFVAPRTAIEEVLAGIWAKVLGVEQIGVHDNFFDLGGHSLKAVQVLSRVGDAFRVRLPLRSLFEATTVASLANLIIAHEAKPGQSEKIAQILKRIKAAPAEDRRALLEQKKAK